MLRSSKASIKESSKEIAAFQGAGARILAGHNDACTKITGEASTSLEALLTQPLNISGIVKAIAAAAKELDR